VPESKEGGEEKRRRTEIKKPCVGLDRKPGPEHSVSRPNGEREKKALRPFIQRLKVRKDMSESSKLLSRK